MTGCPQGLSARSHKDSPGRGCTKRLLALGSRAVSSADAQRLAVMTAASDTATATPSRSLLHLGSLTPSGLVRVPLSWSLYDFANTIFSYAVVSTRWASG